MKEMIVNENNYFISSKGDMYEEQQGKAKWISKN